MSNYERLISSLDAFIRKYYANRLLRGTLVLLICVLAYVLTVSVGEYYLYLPSWLRIALLGIFIVAGLAALVLWVIVPLSQMNRLGKVISHEQAALIVGRHFPEVSDKLLNILQLKRQGDDSASRELIVASIDQKAAQLSVVPITGAIDLSKNKKYLPYLLPLLLVGIFILVAAPNVFKDASERLLQPTKSFEKPAPFRFVVQNANLQTVRNADFVLKLQVDGNALPSEVFMAFGNDRLPMRSVAADKFEYTFRNVTEETTFRFYAAGYYSKDYTLTVVQKPLLKAFKVQLDYPAYTGRNDEVRTALGDMTVPAGTEVSWGFMAEHTDDALIRLGEGVPVKLVKQGNTFASQYRFMSDTSYTLILRNKKSGVADSFRYTVKVIPDQHPVLQLQEFRDTVSGKQILLNGTAGDDYGISRILFHYEVTDARNTSLYKKNLPLKISAGALTSFQHYFDVGILDLQPGQKLSYYIEAWDNDAVHGSKATRSEVMSYQMFNPEQLDSAINANAEQINSGLSNSSQQTKELQNEYKNLQSKMLQSENMDWQQQQSLDNLMKLQNNLQNQMEAIKKRFEEQVQQSKQKQYSQDLKDKQDELKQQMDNLMNKELQEQMKKLQELMQKLNKEQAFQTMKQLEQDNKLFNMDLQRMQELMKKLEMQMRLEDMAKKMDELAQKQDALKEATDNDKKSADALAKQQEELRKELDDALAKDMKEMQDLNKEMKQKQDIAKEQDAGKEAGGEMKESQEQLGKNQKQNSSKSQKKASDILKDMAKSMRSSAGGMNVEQIDIDIKATRQILTNLMRLSFDQEQLMKKVPSTSPAGNGYIANQHEQSRLKNNSRMIRDSLFALSKRVFQVAATINKETAELEKNMTASVDALEARRTGDAITRQQYVMTHTNNLALMLNEVLSNLMQMQSQAQQGGEGSCSKPGGKTPKPGPGKQLSDIITEQRQLGDAMEQMKDAQNKRQGQGQGQNGQAGNQQGGDKQGQGNGEGEYGDAEQLARMAQQQAAIRRKLQELNSLLNSKGLGNAKEMKELQEQMDRTETDLVNKRTSGELLLRQKEILTRLLRAEKSLREQEQDDKRSSKSGEEISRNIPPELQRFMKGREQLLEQYKTVPPQLKPYYRTMVDNYYQLIGAGK